MNILSAPHKVSINITNKCNLDCLYCGVSSSKNSEEDMDLDEWKRVIKELADNKVFNLLISGGEPFLFPGFAEILRHIFNYHFRISINTNGTRFDDESLQILSECHRLDNIQISLDGPDEKTQDFIRGKGVFSCILRGIDKLNYYGIPFSFFVVVCRNNKDCLIDIVRFSKRIGATQITFCSIIPQGSALSHLDDLFLSFDEEKKVRNELRELNREYPELAGGSLVDEIKRMDQISLIESPEDFPGETNLITSCGGSVSECAIRPEGWVIPCNRIWEYKVGNLRHESFRNIWLNSEGFREFRKRYSRTMLSFLECQGCSYTGICSGGCPAIPYNTGKGIDGWDYSSCFLVETGKKIVSGTK